MKQVLFCGFQRERESTLAIRKICEFGELFASAHQAKAVCVRDKKLSVRAKELYFTQRPQRTQRFYYIRLWLERSLATRDKRAQSTARDYTIKYV